MAVAFDVVNECCVLQNNETALMKASANGCLDVVQVLANDCGVDVHGIDKVSCVHQPAVDQMLLCDRVVAIEAITAVQCATESGVHQGSVSSKSGCVVRLSAAEN